MTYFSLVYLEPNPIWIKIESGVLFTNDVFISFDDLDSGSESMDFSYEISGETTPDKLYWRLFDQSNTVVFEDVVPAKLSGNISWDGRIRNSTTPPGKYALELEAFQKGTSLGVSNRHNITIYRINIDIAGTSSKREKNPGAIIEVGAAPTDLTVHLEPKGLSGSIVLRTIGNTDSFIVTDNGDSLPLGNLEGVSFIAAEFSSPRTLQVLAILPTINPIKLQVQLIPNDSPNGEALSSFVYLHALELNLQATCTNKDAAQSTGVFLQRNPHTITTTEDLKKFSPLMQPLTVTAQPTIGKTEIILEYESGSASTALYDNNWTPSIVSLPKTWTGTDFNKDTKQFESALLVSGNDYGEAVFNLRYLSNGVEIAKRRIKIRVDDLPGLAGSELTIHPFFNYQRVFNEGGVVKTAIDPYRFSSRVLQPAAIYIVPHRNSEEWANNKSLANAVAEPIPITIKPEATLANITEVTSLAPGSYDIVYDFGNCPSDPSNFLADGTLGAGDIIDTIIADTPSITTIPSLLEPGPFSIATAEYGADHNLSTTFVPQGYDGLNFLNGYNFRLRGKLVFPEPVPDETPLIVLAHGNHIPLIIALPGQGSIIVSPKMTSDENYRGFTYLQSHLASHGYTTLSIYLDEAYGYSGVGYPEILDYGIYIRANLILRNIEEVLTNPSIAGGALTAKIDPAAIYLIGHSRSGEAAINTQALLSGTAPKPANGLPYLIPPSSIRGIISIAPTSIESTPISAGTPFLLIYGSADRDVDGATAPNVWPLTHFDRATGPRSHLIYAIGANHNYFNDSWPHDDLTRAVLQPYTEPIVVDLVPSLIDQSSLLSRDQQKDLAKAYSLAFLKAYHEQKNAYLAYLTTPPSLLRPPGLDTTIPLTGAWTVPEHMSSTVIDDYENLSSPSFTFSSSGVPITFTGIHNIAEGKLADKELASEIGANNRFFQDTSATLFDWNTPAEYRFEFSAPQNIHNSTISLRVAQQPLHAQTLALDNDLDFSISIIDKFDNSSTLRASAWLQARRVYPSSAFRDFYPDSQGNMEIVWDNTTKGVFETFTFPWWAFVAEGRTIDLSSIAKIVLSFGSGNGSIQGRIAIDDVEIWQ